MTAMIAMPHHDRLQSVLLERHGSGWRVGVGSLLSGEIEEQASCHLGEREAVSAALALADARDLIAVRS